MAKKKDFTNIVEESFEAGYNSEPEINKGQVQPLKEQEENRAETAVQEVSLKKIKEVVGKKGFEEALKVLSAREKEMLLRILIAGDEDIINKITSNAERSTYYITDVHRACIELISHQEGINKGQVVEDALDAWFKGFSDDLIKNAEERVITMAIKKLERSMEN